MTTLITLLFLQLCTQPQTQRIGNLPTDLDEASGIAVSRTYPDRVYHVNDSGDQVVIYVTSKTGGNVQTVTVRNYNPDDVEDLGLGACGNGRSCLFIADIGDNDVERKTIELIIVEEPAQLGRTAPIFKRIRMQYPDGPHNAESLAVHPDGTVFLLTKDERGTERLFKLSKQQWQESGNGIRILTPAGMINFRDILPNTDSFGIRPTAMDISEDGRRLLVLTYRDAVEFSFDVRRPEPASQPRRIPLQFLIQQEAAAYVPGESSFFYTSEYVIFPAWIMKASCGG